MALIGADADELRLLADRFAQSSNSLEESIRSLTNQISHAGIWRGADADSFRSQWTSTDSARLKSVVVALREATDTLRRNAFEQENASSAGGGSTVGSGALGTSPKNTVGLFDAIKHHAADSHDGIRIQKVVGADGKERFIVYMDGTDSAPGKYSLPENGPAALGLSTSTREAILEKMRQQNITDKSDVMLVGFSQGGLYAQSIAQSGEFGSPMVVTYGSPATGHVIPGGLGLPIAIADAPRAGVDVLRLEANNDEVVHFVNPFGASHTTNEGVRDLFGAGDNDATFTSGSHDLPAADGEALRSGHYKDMLTAHSDSATYQRVADAFDNSADPQYSDMRSRINSFTNADVVYDSDPS